MNASQIDVFEITQDDDGQCWSGDTKVSCDEPGWYWINTDTSDDWNGPFEDRAEARADAESYVN